MKRTEFAGRMDAMWLLRRWAYERAAAAIGEQP